MENKKFWTLTLSGISHQDEDILTAILFEEGASGVQENLIFCQKDKKYLPLVEEQKLKTLIAYFPEPPPVDLEQDLKSQFENLHWSLNEEINRDWLEEWKKDWKPFVLWNNIWVVPSWLLRTFDRSGKRVLQIDPGMAFGTGTHATTQIASQLIGQSLLLKEVSRALDVGTGSGILALLLAELGVPRISAYDNDEESHRVFLENINVNGKDGIVWDENWSQINPKNLDLVVANIIDGVLLELKTDFMKLSRPGMKYIFTGILKEREKSFLEEMMQGWDLEVIDRIDKEEWVGFILEAQQ